MVFLKLSYSSYAIISVQVLSAGNIIEFDKPDILLSDTQGEFYSMVNPKDTKQPEIEITAL